MTHHPVWPDQVATEQAKANIMTTFRPDTSFPYLKIAREHNVPYGEVIRFVENILSAPDWEFQLDWERAASGAWLVERQRRERTV